VSVFFRRLRFGQKESVAALLLLAATPFIFFNTIYVWPSFSRRTFCLIQYFISGYSKKKISRLLPHRNFRCCRRPRVMSHGSCGDSCPGYLSCSSLGSFSRTLAPCRSVRGRWSAAVIAPWFIWSKTVARQSIPFPIPAYGCDFVFSDKRRVRVAGRHPNVWKHAVLRLASKRSSSL